MFFRSLYQLNLKSCSSSHEFYLTRLSLTQTAFPNFVIDLLQCTHEPNVSIPTLANLLIERTVNNGSWVVVFKSIITVHHLMCYGNEVRVQAIVLNINNIPLQ